jgi:hypothetical protein
LCQYVGVSPCYEGSERGSGEVIVEWSSHCLRFRNCAPMHTGSRKTAIFESYLFLQRFVSIIYVCTEYCQR